MTLLGHEREMLGLYVSDHPLLGLEHVLSNGTDCTIGQLMLDEERPDGSPITISGLVTVGAAQDHQARRRLGDGHPRGPRRRDRRAAVPQRLPAGQHLPRRGRDHHGQGPAVAGARTSPRSTARRSRSPTCPTARPGPVVISLPSTRCTAPVVEQLKDVLGTHPGMTEVRLRLLTRERDHGHAARRPAPGHAQPRAVRRPQAAAGAWMPDRLSARPAVARRPVRGARGRWRLLVVARCRRARGRRGLGVALDPRPSASSSSHQWVQDEAGLRGEFSGTGWYVVVAPRRRAARRRSCVALVLDRARAGDAASPWSSARCWPAG